MADHGKAGGHLPSSGRALTISGWLTGIYIIIELAIGLYTGSISVISDAFHTFSAVGGVLLAIIAARLARLPADSARTYKRATRLNVIRHLLSIVDCPRTRMSTRPAQIARWFLNLRTHNCLTAISLAEVNRGVASEKLRHPRSKPFRAALVGTPARVDPCPQLNS